jgi:hypothetical protein
VDTFWRHEGEDIGVRGAQVVKARLPQRGVDLLHVELVQESEQERE